MSPAALKDWFALLVWSLSSDAAPLRISFLLHVPSIAEKLQTGRVANSFCQSTNQFVRVFASNAQTETPDPSHSHLDILYLLRIRYCPRRLI
ncbi:hypothetical protein B0T24DRAFT_611669 [Lasiosphaeria ovina]|uniref:Secreted protein n=1 Tax=Lasiosphaeria ovina TaxID=92902 RepID=A0AAE0NDD4_9PEZI|nr:hypothetical protein B0T24DRAFT_611669 [Lasiosphaeria ovina]